MFHYRSYMQDRPIGSDDASNSQPLSLEEWATAMIVRPNDPERLSQRGATEGDRSGLSHASFGRRRGSQGAAASWA